MLLSKNIVYPIPAAVRRTNHVSVSEYSLLYSRGGTPHKPCFYRRMRFTCPMFTNHVSVSEYSLLYSSGGTPHKSCFCQRKRIALFLPALQVGEGLYFYCLMFTNHVPIEEYSLIYSRGGTPLEVVAGIEPT